jgi:cytochrome b involved in lipid metabolism
MPTHISSYIIQKLQTQEHIIIILKDFYHLQWIFSVSLLCELFSLSIFVCFLLLDVLNNLQSKLLNLTVGQLPKRKQFTLKDVSAHCSETDCWMVIKDLVYDLTDFLREVCS